MPDSVEFHGLRVEQGEYQYTYDGLRNKVSNYTLFLDKFVRQIVGARRFDKLAVDVSLSQFVRVSDEAFALLVYENQEHRWKMMLAEGVTKIQVRAKYTDGGYASKDTGRSRKSRGWDNEGIHQFNALCRMVQLDRQAAHAFDFEQGYMAHRRAIRAGRSNREQKKRAKQYASDRVVVESVFHEMDCELVSMSQEGTTPVGPAEATETITPDVVQQATV